MSDKNKKNTPSGKLKLWSYNESFTFSAALIVAGFFLEYSMASSQIALPGFPYNLWIIGGYLFITLISFYFLKGNIVKWLVSIPSVIASVSSMTFLVLLMGFIPQNDVASDFATQLGLTHITRSWPYLLIALYLITTLTFSIYKRFTFPITLKKVAYFMNHAGLWIVIVSASLGTADLKRLTMDLQEGEKKDYAVDRMETPYRVPFEIHLHDFIMDEYPPKLAVYNVVTGELLRTKKDKNPVTIVEDMDVNIDDWKVKVIVYLPNAVAGTEGYIAQEVRGACPAALVEVSSKKFNIAQQQWVSSGSAWVEGRQFPISRNYTMVMLSPAPKKYASDLTIKTPQQEAEEITLEVNKPFKFDSWTIYQTGYDSRLGKYSRLSVLELVYDPWLNVVYLGIFMMIAGSFYLMLFGKRN